MEILVDCPDCGDRVVVGARRRGDPRHPAGRCRGCGAEFTLHQGELRPAEHRP